MLPLLPESCAVLLCITFFLQHRHVKSYALLWPARRCPGMGCPTAASCISLKLTACCMHAIHSHNIFLTIIDDPSRKAWGRKEDTPFTPRQSLLQAGPRYADILWLLRCASMRTNKKFLRLRTQITPVTCVQGRTPAMPNASLAAAAYKGSKHSENPRGWANAQFLSQQVPSDLSGSA